MRPQNTERSIILEGINGRSFSYQPGRLLLYAVDVSQLGVHGNLRGSKEGPRRVDAR